MEKLLNGRRIIVLAEDMFEDLELWYPVLRLREEGAEVVIAGTGAPSYKGKNGLPVSADTSADKVSAADFDAVVIPGGYAPDRLRRYPAVLSLVRDMFERGRVVPRSRHAAWVPISAGVMWDGGRPASRYQGRRHQCRRPIRGLRGGATAI
jgi:protease I